MLIGVHESFSIAMLGGKPSGSAEVPPTRPWRCSVISGKLYAARSIEPDAHSYTPYCACDLVAFVIPSSAGLAKLVRQKSMRIRRVRWPAALVGS